MIHTKQILISVLLVLGLVSVVVAQSREAQSLKGITNLRVVVDYLQPNLESIVNASQLQTDIELRLRQNGIIIDPSATALIYVTLNSVTARSTPITATNIEIALMQSVMIPRNGRMTLAVTWRAGRASMIGNSMLAKSVKEDVQDLMNKFLNDYLTVNPKK